MQSLHRCHRCDRCQRYVYFIIIIILWPPLLQPTSALSRSYRLYGPVQSPPCSSTIIVPIPLLNRTYLGHYMAHLHGAAYTPWQTLTHDQNRESNHDSRQSREVTSPRLASLASFLPNRSTPSHQNCLFGYHPP